MIRFRLFRAQPTVALCAIVLFAGCSLRMEVAPPATLSRDFVDERAKALPPSKFEGIGISSTLSQIVNQLGPAKRIGGSGITILYWDVTDGRKYMVGFPRFDPSSVPLYAKFETE
jgi:hypothetical protein